MALLAALTGFVATWVVTLGLAAIIPHLSASTTVDEAILSAVAFSAWSIFLAPIASFVGWRSVREKNQSRYESASTIEERINNLQSASYSHSPIKAGKEVATTIKALEDLRPRYDSEGIFHSYAVDDVFKQAKKIIRADKKDVVEGIAKDGRDPAEIALTALWNVSNQVVSSGRYHVYRGILTDQGKGYLYAYKKTVDVLLDKGFIDKEEAKSNRKSIKENIKSAG